MPFHPDTDEDTVDGDLGRFTRMPYGPPNFVSAFYYLTEVDETSPAFCVVPRSRRSPTLLHCRMPQNRTKKAKPYKMGQKGKYLVKNDKNDKMASLGQIWPFLVQKS